MSNQNKDWIAILTLKNSQKANQQYSQYNYRKTALYFLLKYKDTNRCINNHIDQYVLKLIILINKS